MHAAHLAAALAAAMCAGCASTARDASSASGASGAVAVAPALASEGRGRQTLRGAQCLDPAMARSWVDLDRDTLLVDAGRYKYLIEVSGACSAVGWSHLLMFRGDPISGRVCGNIGDAILTRDYPCTIQGLRLLDKEQYQALLEERETRRKRKPVATP
jgi:hypothetical protein